MNDDTVGDPSFVTSRVVAKQTVDTSIWVTPDEGALTGKMRDRYFLRKLAISLYLSGASDLVIKQRCLIGSKQVYRLIRERCLEVHPDGRPYGWRGLLHGVRIQAYKRRKTVQVDSFGYGAAGALQALLDRHPDLRIEFDKKILSILPNKKLGEVKLTTRIMPSRSRYPKCA